MDVEKVSLQPVRLCCAFFLGASGGGAPVRTAQAPLATQAVLRGRGSARAPVGAAVGAGRLSSTLSTPPPYVCPPVSCSGRAIPAWPTH